MSLRRVGHLAWRRILDETLVLDLRRRVAFGLNESGRRVLEWLGNARSPDAWLDVLSPELREEARAFLARLEEEGLVGRADEEDPKPPGEAPMLGEAPRILWSEPLPQLAQQASPPMEIGNVQCLQ